MIAHRPRPPARRSARARRPALRPARARRLGDRRPACRRTSRSPPPASRRRALFGPEHGFYGVEQDMVAGAATSAIPGPASRSSRSTATAKRRLRPRAAAFDGLDLLVDRPPGHRHAATTPTPRPRSGRPKPRSAAGSRSGSSTGPTRSAARWSKAICSQPGFESFVGAFRLPVRHGLTLGEIVRLEARRRRWPTSPAVIAGRGLAAAATSGRRLGRPWIAPSPNMPSFETALVYPGALPDRGDRVLRRARHDAAVPADRRARRSSRRRSPRALAPLERFGVRFVPDLLPAAVPEAPGRGLRRRRAGGDRRRARVAGYRLGCELLLALARGGARRRCAGARRPTSSSTTGRRSTCSPARAALPPRGRERTGRGFDGLDRVAGAATKTAFRDERREILLYPEARVKAPALVGVDAGPEAFAALFAAARAARRAARLARPRGAGGAPTPPGARGRGGARRAARGRGRRRPRRDGQAAAPARRCCATCCASTSSAASRCWCGAAQGWPRLEPDGGRVPPAARRRTASARARRRGPARRAGAPAPPRGGGGRHDALPRRSRSASSCPGRSTCSSEIRQAMTRPVVGAPQPRVPGAPGGGSASCCRRSSAPGARRRSPPAARPLLMEAALVSLTERDVLHLTCGAFSERWLAIGRALGPRRPTSWPCPGARPTTPRPAARGAAPQALRGGHPGPQRDLDRRGQPARGARPGGARGERRPGPGRRRVVARRRPRSRPTPGASTSSSPACRRGSRRRPGWPR